MGRARRHHPPSGGLPPIFLSLRELKLGAVLLPKPVDLVDQVAHPALELELGIERQVERDGEPVLTGDGPALLAAPLDDHLVRAELVPVDPEAAVVELFEASGLERGTNGGELLAELRAEDRQVRLHAQLARVDLAELDFLDAQLLCDLAR